MAAGIFPTLKVISPELVIAKAQAMMPNISCISISILLSAVFHICHVTYRESTCFRLV